MVADFVGADRALKRLKVTAIDTDSLEHPPTIPPDATLADARAAIASGGMDHKGMEWVAVVDQHGVLSGHVRKEDAVGDGPIAPHVERIEAWVSTEDHLEDALAAMLLTDVGWIAVLDGDRFVGVLTPESVYRSLRRSLDGHDPATTAAAVTGPSTT